MTIGYNLPVMSGDVPTGSISSAEIEDLSIVNADVSAAAAIVQSKLQSLYDAVVAASGGDYTTLGAAIAGGATNIFVKNGTYAESAISDTTANVSITGESREATVINVAGNACTLSGNYLTLRNIKFTSSGGLITMGGGDKHVEGCRFVSTSGATFVQISGSGKFIGNHVESGALTQDDHMINIAGTAATFSDNLFEVTAGSNTGTAAVNIHSTFTRNIFSDNVVDVNLCTNCTGLVGGATTVDHSIFNGNQVYGAGGTGSNAANGFDFSSVSSQSDYTLTGNYFSNCDRGLVLTGTFMYTVTGNQFASCKEAIYLDTLSHVTIAGNSINCNSVASSVGVTVTNAASQDVVITGNTFNRAVTGISVASGVDRTIISGNQFGDQVTTPITDAGNYTEITGNQGQLSPIIDKKFLYIKNTDGDALANGDLVVLKAVAAGNEVTHTTNQGDDMVWGMAVETIADNASGYIQIAGKVTTLKVNGTDNIAIGNPIGTFTSEGIGQKAAAGDMAIAIALEAYETDDSAGVIDALLITPRKI